ncbi:hypothetical protein [Pseudalkalibacillus caeni]|uniref:Uncharacterized protein n=1 Tax=Exobacillus caeni TaxID=2574798 RepID=A0A5R9F342_9BACL|nr:hypothetical protein [Pseudalkalibacillus caeni]TLS35988.1 hypothetical protein FCL54_17500 [Pseudalkalibacillus caeni]
MIIISLLLAFISVIAGIYIFNAFMGKYHIKKPLKWIFGGYAIILIGSVLIYFMLPEDTFTHAKTYSDEEIMQEEKNQEELYRLALNGKIDQVDDKYITQQWEFELKDDRLVLTAPEPQHSAVTVLAERAGTDKKIKIDYYGMKRIVGNVDVSSKVKAPELEFGENTIHIRKREKVNVKVANFSKEFTVKQFSDGKKSESRMSAMMDQDFLYMQIPVGVEVTGGVIFIDE